MVLSSCLPAAKDFPHPRALGLFASAGAVRDREDGSRGRGGIPLCGKHELKLYATSVHTLRKLLMLRHDSRLHVRYATLQPQCESPLNVQVSIARMYVGTLPSFMWCKNLGSMDCDYPFVCFVHSATARHHQGHTGSLTICVHRPKVQM